jgi:hypothetical protein
MKSGLDSSNGNKKNLDAIIEELEQKIEIADDDTFVLRLDKTQKLKLEQIIMRELPKLKERLGPRALKEIEAELKELEPRAETRQVRKEGSIESISGPTVRTSDRKRYLILRELHSVLTKSSRNLK